MEPAELPLPSPFNLTPLIQEVEVEQGWGSNNKEEEEEEEEAKATKNGEDL